MWSELVAELVGLHGCHTVILYGSRAQGTETEASDIDMVCFRQGAAVADCRRWRDYWLDAWIKPEAEAQDAKAWLHLDGGRVLCERAGFGTDLLERVGQELQKPPEPLAPDADQHLRSWMRKTLARIERGDAEGWYRRHWMIAEMLENCMALRGQRFLGFKRAMLWLEQQEPQLHGLFRELYGPEPAYALIEQVVQAVLATPTKD